MGFLSHRRRHVEVKPEQKWDFISLNDFKSTSAFTPLAYGYLWFSLVISVAVYAVDIFTAYQLLAFNRWSSQIEPAQFVPFDISKWIFTVCILLSFVNLAYEYFRAITIMRRGSVAECFLDSLAARLESIRMGEGKGWKRFLVFAELTRSKKGAEYIALFTFFSFQSWIRILLCSGPRQAINALTLYSVYDARLQINQSSFESSLADFFDKIKALATEEPRQAVILSGMLFTLVVWVFSFLSLLLAALFFVFFLWSYIPREDGGLTGFCERKVNKRLKQIVAIKINKAMAEEERKRKKAELKAAKKNGGDRPVTMKPSIPVLDDDDLSKMPTLNRADTFASFTEKPSRPSSPGSFELNSLGRRPPMPTRSETKHTVGSEYSAEASLLGSAAGMGVAPPRSAAPTLPPLDLDGYPPARTATTSSNGSYGPAPQPRRMLSNGSSLRGYTASPVHFTSEAMPSEPPPVQSPTGSFHYGGPGPNQPRLPYLGDGRPPQRGDARFQHPGDDNRFAYAEGNRWPQRDNAWPPHPNDMRLPHPRDDEGAGFDSRSNGHAGPAPPMATYHSNPMWPRGQGPGGYPLRSATDPMAPRGQPQPQFPPPSRAMTQPMRPFHRPTDSRGSLGSNQPPPSQPFPPYQPRHRPSASNSSLRNMASAAQYGGDAGGSEYGGASRPNQQTRNDRWGPRGDGNGNDSWSRDLERGGGGGPRY
ncbi:hypothetical protein VTH06DRAFT_7726 [Thermothelomyces fergusii]